MAAPVIQTARSGLATSTTTTIAFTDNCSTGDMCVVEIIGNNSVTFSAPDGTWIALGTASGGRGNAYYKIMSSGDISTSHTFTVATGSSSNTKLHWYSITGFDTTTPIADANLAYLAGTSLTAAAVTATQANSLLVGHSIATAAQAVADTPPGSPMTTAINVNTTADRTVVYQVIGAGSSGTETWTLALSGTRAIGLYVVNPSSTNITITGVVATVASAAPAGTVSITQNPTVAGPVATTASAAPAGAVSTQQSVAVAGALGTVASVAPAGTVAATQSPTLAGPVATVASAAPAGSVSTGTDATIVGPVATVTSGAPAGSVVAIDNVTIAGPVSTVAVAALAGIVRIDAILPGPTATIASAAVAGTATVTANPNIGGPVAPVSTTAPAGGVSTQNSATIPGAVGLATSTALVGTITITANPTIAAPIANITTAAPAGTVISGNSVVIAGPIATVSIVALAPTVPAPDERTCAVAVASRVYAAPALLRTCTVPAAPRTVEVT